mgnify:CR=1 FL=1
MKLARVSSNKGSLSRNAKTQTQGKNMVRDRISFASRLKELRMIAHISQIELAEQLHVSRAAVANWETGRTRPDIANIPALCSLLDISIEEFFSDSSDPDSNAELRLLSSYRKLASPHRAIVLSMTEQLLAAERSMRIDPQNVPVCRKCKLSWYSCLWQTMPWQQDSISMISVHTASKCTSTRRQLRAELT